MHYIFDGYNVIYRLPQFSKNSARTDRDKLIRYISKEKKQLSKKNKLTIVFDGQNLPNMIDIVNSPTERSGIQILFSSETNADDYIVDIVKRTDKSELIVVVTDDKELQTRVRLLSATAIGVEEFFIPNKKDTKKEDIKPSLAYRDLEEINDELIGRSQKCS